MITCLSLPAENMAQVKILKIKVSASLDILGRTFIVRLRIRRLGDIGSYLHKN